MFRLFFVPCLIIGSFVHGDYEYQYYKPGYAQYPIITNDPPPAPSATTPKKEKECPPPASVKEAMKGKEVILDKVKVVIIAPEMPPEYIRKTAKGVELYRVLQDVPPYKREQLKKKIASMTLDKTLTFDKLDAVRTQISNFYKNNGQALVVVTIPPQDVTDGVVIIEVTEARLGEITVTGNHWFSQERYLSYLSNIEPDQVIKNSTVEDDVDFINLNPWRKANVIYKAGEKPGTTDIELAVQDARPFRFYAGADNTGFEVTDTNRLFIGFNWGNTFDLDQILAFQYTCSPDFSKFQAVMVHYTAPLPWRDLWVNFGGYSRIVVNHNFVPENVSLGQSWQYSTRYVMPLAPHGTWKQEAKFGLDYKATNNDLSVGETSISNLFATIFQFMGSYETSFKWGQNNFELYGEGYLQPWSIGESMSAANYDLLRPSANPYYFYGRIGGTYNWYGKSTDMNIRVRARTQFSSAALLPLEEYGIGGVNTVRGYNERAVNVDQALILNLDVFTPSASIGKNVFKIKGAGDKLRAVAFLDLGWGGLINAPFPQPSGYFLAGIGPGVRYEIDTWLQFKFDWGFKLTDAPFGATSDSFSQIYFSLVASY